MDRRGLSICNITGLINVSSLLKACILAQVFDDGCSLLNRYLYGDGSYIINKSSSKCSISASKNNFVLFRNSQNCLNITHLMTYIIYFHINYSLTFVVMHIFNIIFISFTGSFHSMLLRMVHFPYGIPASFNWTNDIFFWNAYCLLGCIIVVRLQSGL